MKAPAGVLPPAAERTFIDELGGRLGERVVVHGWFVALRRAKTVRFLVLRDRSGSVQAVFRSEADTCELDALTPETAVRVTGTVRETTAARFGAFEIEVEAIDVVAPAEAPLPLSAGASPELRLDHRHLDLRSPERFLIFAVQTTFQAAVREFLLARAFIEIHTPKLTAGGSESGAAVFELPYFGDTACLVQSPQFYVQMAMAAGFDRVFEVGPVFRAEESVSHLHATEFTCVDVEMAWIESHEELMDVEEELLRHALSRVREVHGADIRRCFGVPVEIPDGPIPRIPLARARELAGCDPGEGGGRLTQRAEQALSKHARERYGHSFVFLTDYPAAERPFYTMQQETPHDTGTQVRSRSFDLLFRGIEITSGCQREHRLERLRAQVSEAGLGREALGRYLDRHYFEMFRFGCPPHGGFGIGLDRLTMALLAQPSIRETSFVFRGPGRYVP